MNIKNKNIEESYLSLKSFLLLIYFQSLFLLEKVLFYYNDVWTNQKITESLNQYTFYKFFYMNEKFSFLSRFSCFDWVFIPIYVYILLNIITLIKCSFLKRILISFINKFTEHETITVVSSTVLMILIINLFAITMNLFSTDFIITTLNNSNRVQCYTDSTCQYLISNLNLYSKDYDKDYDRNYNQILGINELSRNLKGNFITNSIIEYKLVSVSKNIKTIEYKLKEYKNIKPSNITWNNDIITIPKNSTVTLTFTDGDIDVFSKNCLIQINNVKSPNGSILNFSDFLSNLETKQNFIFFEDLSKSDKNKFNNDFLTITLNSRMCEKFKSIK